MTRGVIGAGPDSGGHGGGRTLRPYAEAGPGGRERGPRQHARDQQEAHRRG
ncbi:MULTISPECIES: hypothetical protein [Streptomyces]|uniref:hypothetical protein n=1 Tax=Streptomyces TaxID=1883 RepID=UPI0016516557|nr:hypothetical protein [Streptomyces sp. 8ZJF_21]MCD9589981.1 hypothetical protein [Streptomyces sp. 8ZJF_21]MCQ6251505.1 hypothetical protein [Streptomyces malaysiensis]